MIVRGAFLFVFALWLLAGEATPAWAAMGRDHGGSITDRSIQWPTAEEWQRVLTLRDYNTRVVLTGTGLLGFAAGVLGCFTLLRKRALMGDALSHATLPGIGLAFMFSVLAGGTGKALPVLLVGAAATGLLGLVMILAIRNLTRLKEDTALGIVLSVFFGAGVSVLGVVQRMGQGHAAGLESFIYGKTASMLASDAQLIAWIAALVLIACATLFKEFRLVCFDAGYAKAQGWPTVLLDSAMMCLVIVITVIGLQAVGLILIIALLIIPAAAARFWTERLLVMLGIAGFIGALSGLAGSALSALLPNMPSGAMIVLLATLLFLVSMFFGSARGVFIRWLHRRAFESKVRRQHLLRAAFELMEGDEIGPEFDGERIGRRVKISDLLAMRSWSHGRLRREIARAARAGLVAEVVPGREIELTPEGFREAAQLVRQHRLWELYLITHADIAPSHVDRDADAIEHVLDPAMIRELETLLAVERPRVVVPRSPHLIDAPTATASPTH
jgi:manganese/zinc/iron transport system permease protein